MKFMEPGVSIRSTEWPSWVRWPTARCMVLLRSFSSASKSSTEVPWSTEPIFLVAPARKSSASARVVLPAPPWAIKPIVYTAMKRLLKV